MKIKNKKSLFLIFFSLLLFGCIQTDNQNLITGKIKKITINQVDTSNGFNEAYTLEFRYNSNALVEQVLYNGLDFIRINNIDDNKTEFIVHDIDNNFTSMYYVYITNNRVDSINMLDTITHQQVNWFIFHYNASNNIDSLYLSADQGFPYTIDLKYFGYNYLENYLHSNIEWGYYNLVTLNYYDKDLDYAYTTNLNDANIPMQMPFYDVFGSTWISYFDTGFPLYLYALNLNGIKSFKENKNLMQSVNNSHINYEFANSKVSKMVIANDINPLTQNISLEYY
jgi:hypothetical protein